MYELLWRVKVVEMKDMKDGYTWQMAMDDGRRNRIFHFKVPGQNLD